tara:strand:+ start:233 stop:418 length:186 start_codon:yes stop_codon:yes gene_type:complete
LVVRFLGSGTPARSHGIATAIAARPVVGVATDKDGLVTQGSQARGFSPSELAKGTVENLDG